MHGKTSPIRHDGAGLYADLPNPFEATRYHSLMVEPKSLPSELEVTATSPDGLIMGMNQPRAPHLRRSVSPGVDPDLGWAGPPS